MEQSQELLNSMQDPSTELYQRMQYSHEQYRQLARASSDNAIDKNTKDYNKKAYPRQFYEGEWVNSKDKRSLSSTTNQTQISLTQSCRLYLGRGDNNAALWN